MELRDRLGKAKIFFKFDLRNGFHLIRMKEGEEWKIIIASITEITKKSYREFRRIEITQEAFESFKEAFVGEPVLKVFDPELPIIVETDSLDYIIGAILS
ncbi:hypothetical protein SS1G_00286 [Sclerotinia sclerotiorum 1980 UF-70]|uniref:Reverse transcriptase/retrotransposon-derived protein RNase H-like domain-containing protein n=1 Tax=Sclerotinia sclerotiorum (strain ATCC 18683 / 1980 / Ss-1) TaxID=665079 RepID=A7E4R4_SCLS1|nr:hypothetical protein SS1G_00286 [Sclerotinia sclerotiorum 1980 UF-70]EDN90886.1 hypothetical protein SS1G_00286 [Sclerotinia sclerotiorum 1980 UF-70]